MKMTNFVFSQTLRGVNGSYRQTVTNVETGATFSRRSGRDGKPTDILVSPGTCPTDTLLDELVAAWQAAWQHDEELETQARLQSEDRGYFVTLSSLRRTWGDWWISGDRPIWAVGKEEEGN